MNMTDLISHIVQLSDVGIAVLGVVFSLFSIIAAVRSGALKSIRIGSFELQASEREVEHAREIIRAVTTPDSERVPFETEQLANYYAQVLGQSKTSFWFSLVFASIGFLISCAPLLCMQMRNQVQPLPASLLAALSMPLLRFSLFSPSGLRNLWPTFSTNLGATEIIWRHENFVRVWIPQRHV